MESKPDAALLGSLTLNLKQDVINSPFRHSHVLLFWVNSVFCYDMLLFGPAYTEVMTLVDYPNVFSFSVYYLD